MKDREWVTLFIWLAFCAFICIESWQLGVGSFKKPGPGFIPFGASLGIGLIALALLLMRRGKGLVKYVAPFFQKKRIGKVLTMVCLIFFYPLLLNKIGFLLCTLLFVGFSLKLIEPQRWRAVVGISFAVAIVSYVFFDVLLKIQLPKGAWLFFLK